ncbi:LolA family protein [Sandaracinobacteroides sp. A072]|uniref:LolA family protein n=1 Tax=Sandaracinobacteroides sp. A072 TaxID=3461146 RepID=UPI0040417039
MKNPIIARTLVAASMAMAMLSATVVFPAPAVASATVTIADVQRAMGQTSSMTADFTQRAANGGVAQGTMIMKRPGRIRFDYGDKASFLVVADGRTLSFVDYQVAQVSQWPVRSTPLGVLLDPEADLARVARVLPADKSPLPGQVAVLAQDPKRPDIGRITFFLKPDGAAPGGMRLTGWRVVDAQNNLTVVELANAKFNVPVADSGFRFRDPRKRASVPGRMR